MYRPPLITSVGPLPGTPQTTVSFFGDDFGPYGSPITAYINGVPCESSQNLQSLVLCNVPYGVGVNLNVSVVRGFSTVSRPSSARFSYAPPSINAVSGIFNCEDTRDTRVTITGTNFGRNASNLIIRLGITYTCRNPEFSPDGRSVFCMAARANCANIVTANNVTIRNTPQGALFTYTESSPPMFTQRLATELESVSNPPTSGGDVTIYGTGFGNDPRLIAMEVDYGGTSRPCPSLSILRNNVAIVCSGVQAFAGSVPATLTFPGHSVPFTITAAAPVITSIIPIDQTNNGWQLTIRGVSFGTGTNVYVNTDRGPCDSPNVVVAHSQIACTMPVWYGTVMVTVMVEGLEGPPFPYTYGPPVIFSVSTGTAVNYGDTIAIAGRGFVPGSTKIVIGGYECKEALSVPSSGSASCMVTTGSGTMPILIDVADTNSTQNYNLTITPMFDSMNPSSEYPGNQISIRGSNFDDASFGEYIDEIKLGNYTCRDPWVYRNGPSDVISCIIPIGGIGTRLSVVIYTFNYTRTYDITALTGSHFSFPGPRVGRFRTEFPTEGGIAIVEGEQMGLTSNDIEVYYVNDDNSTDRVQCVGPILDTKYYQQVSCNMSAAFASAIGPAPEGKENYYVLYMEGGQSSISEPERLSRASPSIQRATSPSQGGGPVTIFGSSFGTDPSVIQVEFADSPDDAPCAPVTMLVPHHVIECMQPPGRGYLGGIGISVANLDTDGYSGEYNYRPSVINNVTVAPAQGGIITIIGEFLASSVNDEFGIYVDHLGVEITCGDVAFISPQEIRCIMGAGAGMGQTLYLYVNGQMIDSYNQFSWTGPYVSSLVSLPLDTKGGAFAVMLGGLYTYEELERKRTEKPPVISSQIFLSVGGVPCVDVWMMPFDDFSGIVVCDSFPAGTGIFLPIDLAINTLPVTHNTSDPALRFAYKAPEIYNVTGLHSIAGEEPVQCNANTTNCKLYIYGQYFGVPNANQTNERAHVTVGGVECKFISPVDDSDIACEVSSLSSVTPPAEVIVTISNQQVATLFNFTIPPPPPIIPANETTANITLGVLNVTAPRTVGGPITISGHDFVPTLLREVVIQPSPPAHNFDPVFTYPCGNVKRYSKSLECDVHAGTGTRGTILLHLMAVNVTSPSLPFRYQAPTIRNASAWDYANQDRRRRRSVSDAANQNAQQIKYIRIVGDNYGANMTKVDVAIGGTPCTVLSVNFHEEVWCSVDITQNATVLAGHISIIVDGQRNTDNNYNLLSYYPPPNSNETMTNTTLGVLNITTPRTQGGRITISGDIFDPTQVTEVYVQQPASPTSNITYLCDNVSTSRNTLECDVRAGTGTRGVVTLHLSRNVTSLPTLGFRYQSPVVRNASASDTYSTNNQRQIRQIGKRSTQQIKYIHIMGDNYGAAVTLISVTIGGAECVVLAVSTTHDALWCSVDITRNATVLAGHISVIVDGQRNTDNNQNLLSYYPPIIDNDGPVLFHYTVSTGLVTDELGTPSLLGVSLSSPPLSTITIEFVSNDTKTAIITPLTPIVFTPSSGGGGGGGDWQVIRYVNVTGVVNGNNDQSNRPFIITVTVRHSNASSSSPSSPAAPPADIFTIPGVTLNILWPVVASQVPSLMPRSGATVRLSGGYILHHTNTSSSSNTSSPTDGLPKIYVDGQLVTNVSVVPGSLDLMFVSPPLDPSRALPVYVPLVIVNPDGGYMSCPDGDSPAVSFTSKSPGYYASVPTCPDSSILYYSADCPVEGQYGKETCYPCPEGGICPGGNRIWAKQNYWNPNETTVPYPCVPASACPGHSIKPRCNAGYTGLYCSVCEETFFRSGEMCQSCLDISYGMFIPVIIAAGVFFGVIAVASVTLNDKKLDMLVSLLLSLQQLISIGNRASSRISVTAQTLFNALSWVLFDFDWVRPGCSIARITYVQVWVGMMVSVFVFLFVFALMALLRALIVRAIIKNEKLGSIYEKPKELQPPGFVHKIRAKLVGFIIDNMEGGEEESVAYRKRAQDSGTWTTVLKRRLVRCWVILLTVLYINVTTRTLQGLNCQTVNGQMRLQVERNIICYQGDHLTLVPFLYLVLLGYSLGFPLFCAYVVMRAHKQHMTEKRRSGKFLSKMDSVVGLMSPAFSDMFGFLWRDLRASVLWFRLIPFVISMFIALQNALNLGTALQLIVNGAVFLANLLLISWLWPFLLLRTNIIFIVGGLARAVFILILLYNLRDSTLNGVDSDKFFWVALALVIFVIILSIVIRVLRLRGEKKKKVNKKMQQQGDVEMSSSPPSSPPGPPSIGAYSEDPNDARDNRNDDDHHHQNNDNKRGDQPHESEKDITTITAADKYSNNNNNSSSSGSNNTTTTTKANKDDHNKKRRGDRKKKRNTLVIHL
eukprot:TRINITY_DN859_c0_g1_i1.p1 TRINITY_DN859_c0_g1~~TRINITY_DN859_c0_g1_i1.p1  ORF type:complete len:2688 (+),score=475.47 TRINITY_DN859_c0_g1_i1:988-8064(+)